MRTTQLFYGRTFRIPGTIMLIFFMLAICRTSVVAQAQACECDDEWKVVKVAGASEFSSLVGTDLFVLLAVHTIWSLEAYYQVGNDFVKAFAISKTTDVGAWSGATYPSFQVEAKPKVTFTCDEDGHIIGASDHESKTVGTRSASGVIKVTGGAGTQKQATADIDLAATYKGNTTVNIALGIVTLTLNKGGSKVTEGGQAIFKCVCTSDTQEIRAVDTDAFGNVYFAGKFRGAIYRDSTVHGGYGLDDIFHGKRNPDGTLAWIRTSGSKMDDQALAVAADANGNSVATGFFRDTVDFDGTQMVSTFEDAFVVKRDSLGNILWINRIKGPGSSRAHGVAIDPYGNVIVTGYFSSVAEFSPSISLTSSGISDAFIAKYSPEGNLLWVRQAGGTGIDNGNAIATDLLGNIAVAGIFHKTAYFGQFPDHTILNNSDLGASANSEDGFVAKYDPNGELIGAVKLGGDDQDFATGITIDQQGNIVATGHYKTEVSFEENNTMISEGGYDAYVVKYSPDLNFLWAQNIGGQNLSKSYSVTSDENSQLLVTGNFMGTARFDSISLMSMGMKDIFVAGYSPAGSLNFVERHGGTEDDYSNSISSNLNGKVNYGGCVLGPALIGNDSVTPRGKAAYFVADLFAPVLLNMKESETGEVPVSVYPNPFREDLNMVFDVSEAGNYQITIYDLQGTEVWNRKEDLEIGKARLALDFRPSTGKGVYLLTLRHERKMLATKKIYYDPKR